MKHMQLRNIISQVAVVFISFLAATSVFGGGTGMAFAAQEQIDSFDAEIRINADASVDITETIRYDFGSSEKHGIYRYVPVRYAARGGNFSVRMEDITVKDENGAACEFEVADSGGDKEIKIGSADTLVSGAKTYIIGYRMERVINYFDDHDEFYWNVTGNGFKVPIVSASATVYYPKELEKTGTDIACYAGALGSSAACSSAQYLSMGESNIVSGVSFAAQRLSSGEGLTVIVGMPKGVVYQPTRAEILRDALFDNLVLFVPFLTLIAVYCIWRKKGKDPQGRGTIIAEFDVPDRVTPAEAGTMADENCDQKELTAEIIELAVKGYLRIRREEKKMLLIKSTDYGFERLKEADENLSAHEKIILSGIFGKKKTAKLSDLKMTFYQKYADFTKEVYASVFRKGYFVGNPQTVQLRYFALYFGSLVVVFAFILAATGSAPGAYAALSFIASLAIAGVFAYFMPQKTKEGVLLREKILGLKEYLSVAEKDRLKFHNAPEKDPQEFERLLPYAIVLGVEKDWARQFEGIYNASPSWYQDPRGVDNFTALYFVNSLSDFRSDFSAGVTAPAATSGSSGLSGGGFSGGGFGGGGGGSW